MIRTIAGRAFNGLTNQTLTLHPQVTLLLGPNGAGKTSFQLATEYALTGACRRTDKRGAGYAALINHAHPAGAEVEVVTDTYSVLRQITPKSAAALEVTANGQTREGADAKASLSTFLPATDLLLTMLRSDGLTALSGKEQQDLLFGLAGGETDAQWVVSKLTAGEAEIMESHLATRLQGSALFDRLYKAAYDKRTGANALLKAAQGKLSAFTFPAPGEATTDADALKQQAADLKHDLANVQQKIGAAQSLATAHAQAKARQQQAGESVDRLNAALAALPECNPPTDEDIAALEAAEGKAQETSLFASQALSEVKATRAARQAQLDQFVKLAGSCVLGDTPCAMDPEARAKLVKREQKDIDKLEAVIAEGETAADLAGQAVLAARKARETAHEQRTTAASIERDRERLTSDLARANDELKATLTEAKDAVTVDVPELQAQAAELQQQIAALEQQEQQARRGRDAVAEKARLDQESAAAKTLAELLDGLVKKLAPEGLPAQAMAATLGSVFAAVNAVLAEFTDLALSAEPGKDFALLINRPGDCQGTPVSGLSGGEALMVGAAIQVAFAKLTGFGFVIVDQADTLDATNLPGLIAMLAGSGVQSLVMSSRDLGTAAREWVVGLGATIYDCAEGRLALAA